jgi:N-acetylmuramoyl-L-alanine amidase
MKIWDNSAGQASEPELPSDEYLTEDELIDEESLTKLLSAADETEEAEEEEEIEAGRPSANAEQESAPSPEGEIAPGPHTVEQGECLTNIAWRSGFAEKPLWNHAANASLRARRKDPECLMPGDIITIPERQLRYEICATDQRHRFRRKDVPAKLHVRLLMFGEPRRNVKYLLDVDGRTRWGETDPDGWVNESIPPAARQATITVNPGPDQDEYQLTLGTVDPLDEPSGIQGRLADLGFPCRVTGRMDEQTAGALRRFQQARNLPITGEADGQTMQELEKAHEA